MVYIHVCFQGTHTHHHYPPFLLSEAGRVSWEVGVSQSCLHLRRVGSSHEEVPQPRPLKPCPSHLASLLSKHLGTKRQLLCLQRRQAPLCCYPLHCTSSRFPPVPAGAPAESSCSPRASPRHSLVSLLNSVPGLVFTPIT